MGWSGEDDRGGTLTSSPAIASRGFNTLDCFWRGAEGRLWQLQWLGEDAGGWVGPSETVSGGDTLMGSPAVTLSVNSTGLFVVYRDGESQLWQQRSNQYGNGWDGYPTQCGFTVPSDVSVTRTPDFNDGMHLFYRGAEGDILYRHSLDTIEWKDERSLGGLAASEPAAVSMAPGRLDIFYCNEANNHLTHRWSTNNGQDWSGEEDRGGLLTSAPAATSWANNRIDVFYAGYNHAMKHQAFDGQWSGEDDRGGVLTTKPAAACWGVERIDCVYRGQNGDLWHRFWDDEIVDPG